MIAAPYWGKDEDWQAEDYTLSDHFASKLPQLPHIFLYHSRNDEVVPSSHLRYYKQKLPKAKTFLLDDDDHYFRNGLPILVDDIRGL